MGIVTLDLVEYNELRDENSTLKNQCSLYEDEVCRKNSILEEKDKFIEKVKLHIFEEEINRNNIKYGTKEDCLNINSYEFAFKKNSYSVTNFPIQELIDYISIRWDEAHKEELSNDSL